MKKILLIICVFAAIFSFSNAQTTTYYNSKKEVVESLTKAEFYVVVSPDSSNQYREVIRKYLKSGQIASEQTYYKSGGAVIEDGRKRIWYSNGQIKSEVNFYHGILAGSRVTFDEAGNQTSKDTLSLDNYIGKESNLGAYNEPFVSVEKMPLFPYGNDALRDFMSKNINYPSLARQSGIGGQVIVRFSVNQQGAISNISVLKGLGGGCDEEAIRVVKSMPRWIPGMQGKRFVDVWYTLPIKFTYIPKVTSKSESQYRETSTPFVLKFDNSEKNEPNDEKALSKVEQMPEFVGGEKALFNFINSNIRYPVAALENGISGRVIVRFAIDKNGAISSVSVIKGIGGGCDEEAIRLIQKMPNWIPGRQDGNPVPVWYTLPIVFTISK